MINYYHQGGWTDFAADIISALANAGEKQLKGQEKKEDPKGNPLADVVSKVKDGAAQAARQQVKEQLSPWIIVAVLYFLMKQRR